jgi:hypothetical protein
VDLYSAQSEGKVLQAANLGMHTFTLNTHKLGEKDKFKCKAFVGNVGKKFKLEYEDIIAAIRTKWTSADADQSVLTPQASQALQYINTNPDKKSDRDMYYELENENWTGLADICLMTWFLPAQLEFESADN